MPSSQVLETSSGTSSPLSLMASGIKFEIQKTVDVSEWKKLGYELAHEILAQGGSALMAEIKKSLQKLPS